VKRAPKEHELADCAGLGLHQIDQHASIAVGDRAKDVLAGRAVRRLAFRLVGGASP
jgi:hypothetical protein